MDRRPTRTQRTTLASPIPRTRRANPLQKLRPEDRRLQVARPSTRSHRPGRMDRPRCRRCDTRRVVAGVVAYSDAQGEDSSRIRIPLPIAGPSRVRDGVDQSHLSGGDSGVDRRDARRRVVSVTGPGCQGSLGAVPPDGRRRRAVAPQPSRWDQNASRASPSAALPRGGASDCARCSR